MAWAAYQNMNNASITTVAPQAYASRQTSQAYRAANVPGTMLAAPMAYSSGLSVAPTTTTMAATSSYAPRTMATLAAPAAYSSGFSVAPTTTTMAAASSYPTQVEYVSATSGVGFARAPQVDYAAYEPAYSYEQPIYTSSPQVEYVAYDEAYGQPMVEYMSSPQVEYVSAAPVMRQQATEYVTSMPQSRYATGSNVSPQVEYVSAAPVMRQQATEYVTSMPQSRYATGSNVSGASRNLLAMGNVVSERIVSVEELAVEGRLVEAPAERARGFSSAPMIQSFAQPVEYMYEDVQPGVEYVYETMQPGVEYVEYMQEPGMIEYVSGAPSVQYYR